MVSMDFVNRIQAGHTEKSYPARVAIRPRVEIQTRGFFACESAAVTSTEAATYAGECHLIDDELLRSSRRQPHMSDQVSRQ